MLREVKLNTPSDLAEEEDSEEAETTGFQKD
jgi:hypothetical protein